MLTTIDDYGSAGDFKHVRFLRGFKAFGPATSTIGLPTRGDSGSVKKQKNLHLFVAASPASDAAVSILFCDVFGVDWARRPGSYRQTQGPASCQRSILAVLSAHRVQKRMGLGLIDAQFSRLKNTPSDINEHMDLLHSYARHCTHITELGTRTAVSTWAFLRGLQESKTAHLHPTLLSMDLQYHLHIEQARLAAEQAGITFGFVLGDSTKIRLAQTDLLFIDTWHVYAQLKRELALHAPLTNKFIIMHDTTLDGEHGTSVRNGWNTADQATATGFPEEEICKGLWPAVEEFLASQPEWSLIQRLTNNNGLTILGRTSRSSI